MVATYSRQVCLGDDSTDKQIQLSVLQYRNKRSRCVSTDRLGYRKQFHQSAIWLIPKILKKVTQTKCVAMIIAPHWPSQPWFRKLQQMSVDYPVRIPNHPNVMLRRVAMPEPMKNIRWKIFTWRIPGLLA